MSSTVHTSTPLLLCFGDRNESACSVVPRLLESHDKPEACHHFNWEYWELQSTSQHQWENINNCAPGPGFKWIHQINWTQSKDWRRGWHRVGLNMRAEEWAVSSTLKCIKTKTSTKYIKSTSWSFCLSHMLRMKGTEIENNVSMCLNEHYRVMCWVLEMKDC